ncbi:MAG: hypothetical protein ACREDL_06425, partial [Bradyrhizobium sp.]
VPMTATKRRIGDKLRDKRISEETISQRIWPRYRPVAPYWCALIARGVDAKAPFPCRPSDLGSFLAAADAIRRQGEGMHAPRSPIVSILRVGETVAIPAEIFGFRAPL